MLNPAREAVIAKNSGHINYHVDCDRLKHEALQCSFLGAVTRNRYRTEQQLEHGYRRTSRFS